MRLFFALLSLLASWKSFCTTWVPDTDCKGYFQGLDFKPYVGYVFGDNHEYVFNNDDPSIHYKESQLDWKLRNLWVLGWKAQANCIADRLHVFFNGWAHLTASSFFMVDRDWLDINQPGPTDISWRKSYVTKAFKLVGEIDYDFCAIDLCPYNLKFGVLTGYEFLDLHWDSHGGGPFDYDSGTNKGHFFPGEHVVYYQQQFSIPYLGLQVHCLRQNNWGLLFFGKGSWFASAKDNDFHSYTGTLYVDKFGGNWWSLGTALHGYFWKGLGLELTYTYEQMNRTIGSDTENNIFDGSKIYIPDGSGISFSQNELTLGFLVSF